MNIYVGNLPRAATEDEVRSVFESHGSVASVAIIRDKFTGESRGFGFVEMPSDNEAQNAINTMNGAEMGGRPLTVNEARPKTEGGERRGGRSSFGGGGGGGGNRGGRGGGYGGGGNRNRF